MLLLAMSFFVGEYLFFSTMLVYFSKTELIGQLLIGKMLYMVNLIFFAMLIFSNIITAISTYYVSDDLSLLISIPITLEEFFYARLVQTTIKSSWMVLLFGAPIYIAYGTVIGGNIFYYIGMIAALVSLTFVASTMGIIFTIIITYILPARRFREFMLFISIVVFISMYIGFRIARPEQFLNPQKFENVIGYLAALHSSQSMFLPSTWLSMTLLSMLSYKYNDALKSLLPLITTAFAGVSIGVFSAYLFYMKGFTKAQESKTARLKGKGIFYRSFNKIIGKKNIFVNAVIKKDVLGFFRDASQWSQLLLLGALVLVYVYNFTVLPLNGIPFPTLYIKNAVAFFNLGLAAFVITAISARFAFSAVSLEGRAMWLIKVSPNELSELLRAKILYNLVPLLIVAFGIVYFTNHVLGVFWYIMYLSIFTMMLLTAAIANLGVSFGAIYPKYHYENVADIAMGFGGLLFMIVSLGITGLVLLIQAIPTYRVMKEFVFPAGLTFYDYIWISFMYLISFATIVYPVLYIREKAENALKTQEG